MKKLIVIAAALVACGSGAVDTTRTVKGKVEARYWNPSHPDPVAVPGDLRDLQLEAVQGATHHKGVARSDGTFHIDGVSKDAPYWLRIAQPRQTDQYILTNADEVDFGDDVLGAKDADYPTQPSTALLLHLSDLAPWADGDGLELFDPDTATFQPLYVQADPGAQTADAFIGWFGHVLNPDGVRGMRLSQLRRVVDTEQGLSWMAPVGSGVVPPFTLSDGFLDEARASLPEPDQADLLLQWHISDFAQQSAAVHPKYATPRGVTWHLWAQPGARDHFIATGGYGFPTVINDIGPVTFDHDLNAKLTVPAAYPNDWIASQAAMFYSVNVPIPGSPTRSLEVGTIIEVQAAGYGADASPMITPPTAPLVDGKDGFSEQEGIATEAKISWNLPQKGHPTEYAVTLMRWADLDLAKVAMVPESLQPVAVLVVPGDVTSIVVPPGILQKGEYYIAVIDSVHAGANDFKLDDKRAEPYRTPQPYGHASAVTSTFRITN